MLKCFSLSIFSSISKFVLLSRCCWTCWAACSRLWSASWQREHIWLHLQGSKMCVLSWKSIFGSTYIFWADDSSACRYFKVSSFSIWAEFISSRRKACSQASSSLSSSLFLRSLMVRSLLASSCSKRFEFSSLPEARARREARYEIQGNTLQ